MAFLKYSVNKSAVEYICFDSLFAHGTINEDPFMNKTILAPHVDTDFSQQTKKLVSSITPLLKKKKNN